MTALRHPSDRLDLYGLRQIATLRGCGVEPASAGQNRCVSALHARATPANAAPRPPSCARASPVPATPATTTPSINKPAFIAGNLRAQVPILPPGTRQRTPWLILLALLVLGVATPATAQLLDQALSPDIAGVAIEPGVTVTSRRRPDYDARGIHVGSYLFRPEFSESFGYDDNVLATRNKRGSTVLATRADIQATADHSRYRVLARVTADDFRYFETPRQSLTNWTASLGGAYDLGRDVLSLGYVHSNQNQTPRDLNVPLLDQSIAYRIDTLRAGYRVAFNRLSLRPELAVAHYDFDDGTVAGAPYRQNYRNRNTVSPGITASYELAPRREVVVVVRNVTSRYTDRPAGFVNRDSTDTSVLAGLDYDGGGLWRYRLLAGYEVRNFTSPAIKTIQAPVAEATVIFSPTGLTTLTGSLIRRIQDSADESTVGYTETTGRLIVDHEYLRNVLLNANAQATFAEYSQGGGSQVQYSAGARATWLLNRNVSLAATYDFTKLNSSGSVRLANGFSLGGGYSENRYMLQLRLGL